MEPSVPRGYLEKAISTVNLKRLQKSSPAPLAPPPHLLVQHW